MTRDDIIYDYEMESNPPGPEGDPQEGCFLMAIIILICIAIGSAITHGI